MTKFLIRNDDVAVDTTIEEIKQFCEIADRYGFPVMHAIIPIGEAKKIKSAKMTNDQIKAASNRLVSENKEVIDYLLERDDEIGVHGLWHTHQPTLQDIKNGKLILDRSGFYPYYFVPPFNEGDYPARVDGLITCTLTSSENLENFLDKGTPSAEIMYLHSWRFDDSWYTFDQLEKCLQRLCLN